MCVCLCRFRLILCPGSSRSHTWTTATLLSLPKYVNTVRATYTLHTHYSHATTSSTATHEKEARMNYPCFKYLKGHTTRISANKSYVHRPSPQPRTPPSPYTAICCMQTHAYHPSSYANLYEHTFSNRVTWVGLCPLKYRVLSPPKCTRHGMVLANRFRLSLATQPPHCCTPPGLDGITPSVCAPFPPTHQTYPHYSHPVDHVYIYIHI